MDESFPTNLRSLCAEHGSIAQVCREIGINRQQFNRYLSGSGMPSAHNLRRIARHFGLAEADLFADPGSFARRHLRGRTGRARGPADLLAAPFRDQAAGLRRYLGFYHAHFTTPTWEGMILRSLTRLYERDGFVLCRSLERILSRDGRVVQKSRYAGMAARQGNRLYVVEHELVRDGSTVETILTPAHRRQTSLLSGLTLGVAWRPHDGPYAARSIWKRIDDRVSAREAIAACGAFPRMSPRIDPEVRAYLLAEGEPQGQATILT